MLEDVCGRLHRHDVVDDELAESGQVISPFVQFFDLGVVVHLLVVVLDKDVVLDEVVDQLNHRAIGLEKESLQFKVNTCKSDLLLVNRLPWKIKRKLSLSLTFINGLLSLISLITLENVSRHCNYNNKL